MASATARPSFPPKRLLGQAIHRPSLQGYRHRAGLTLVEMMVSVTITLLVVFAIVQVFDIMGSTIAMGRATIEMAGQLRNVTNILQEDLDNLTCPVQPWVDPDAGVGYFEYVEGPLVVQLTATDPVIPSRSSDRDTLGAGINNPPDLSAFGDVDDILAMTVRSASEPFKGNAPDGAGGLISVESNVAEVIWWMALYDSNGNGTPDLGDSSVLLRRALLVRPDLPLAGVNHQDFFFEYDISAHYDGTEMQANSLSDLSDRSKRFAHQYDPNNDPFLFPHNLAIYLPPGTTPVKVGPSYLFKHEHALRVDANTIVPAPTNSGAYETYSAVLPRFISQTAMTEFSEYIVLSDVSGFDARLFDENALGFFANNLAVAPGDFDYGSMQMQYAGSAREHLEAKWTQLQLAISSSPPRVFRGAFVDLGFLAIPSDPIPNPANDADYDTGPNPPENTGSATWNFVCFDTWPLSYERDGIDQDGDGITDQGFDGLDLAAQGGTQNGIDDIAERETSPPYIVAPKGIEVRIRMLEFGTGQVRQASVVGDFTD